MLDFPLFWHGFPLAPPRLGWDLVSGLLCPGNGHRLRTMGWTSIWQYFAGRTCLILRGRFWKRGPFLGQTGRIFGWGLMMMKMGIDGMILLDIYGVLMLVPLVGFLKFLHWICGCWIPSYRGWSCCSSSADIKKKNDSRFEISVIFMCVWEKHTHTIFLNSPIRSRKFQQ